MTAYEKDMSSRWFELNEKERRDFAMWCLERTVFWALANQVYVDSRSINALSAVRKYTGGVVDKKAVDKARIGSFLAVGDIGSNRCALGKPLCDIVANIIDNFMSGITLHSRNHETVLSCARTLGKEEELLQIKQLRSLVSKEKAMDGAHEIS